MARLPQLEQLLERHDVDDVADAALLAGLALIERQVGRTREAVEFRWRSYPRGELRALRRGMRLGLELCRFAVALAEAEREHFERGLHHELHQRAQRAARRRPRRTV